ncbi:citrate synthase family protein [Paraburkholderia sp. CNPSo 3076]|uniref:citrate synthase family protein n=1 Tax=Paraburkholderia sp. CNPSo 3076 TaxID=2940936 RepID=UPI002254EE14|nr:citrate synthase family protein [Paraburkholderia sp. CNPSo 3076]MCX5541204.1 citrate synthase family protein [Paraburkholderia sp. CNPSo 3076]
MTQEEACHALGVRKQTLYAYVSRGRIEVRWDPEHASRKLYRASDVAALRKKRDLGRAHKSIAASTMAWGEPIINTRISTITRGRLYYRGHDAIDLASRATLEDVARCLWETDAAPVFPTFHDDVSVPDGAPPRARVYASMALAAAQPRASGALDAARLNDEAACLVGRFASAFVGPGEIARFGESGALHARLARAWRCEAHADLLRRALALLADQELTTSAFAARVAASTGASLGSCMLAGLAAFAGPLHGDAALRVQALLGDVRATGVAGAVERWLKANGPLPGFGHELYPQGDPRAADLLAAFDVPDEVRALIEYVRVSRGLAPTIDIALTALGSYCHLPEDAVFAIFAIGRSVGWMAHAIEQMTSGTLLRPRANYIGPVGAGATSGAGNYQEY